MNSWNTSRRSSRLGFGDRTGFARDFSTFQRLPRPPRAARLSSSRTPNRQRRKKTSAAVIVTYANIPIPHSTPRSAHWRIGLAVLRLPFNRITGPVQVTKDGMSTRRGRRIARRLVPLRRVKRSRTRRAPLGGSSVWRRRIAAEFHRRSTANFMRRRPGASRGRL